MFYLLKNSIPIYLVILRLCIAKPGVNLSIICSMCDINFLMDKLPKECTAVAEYTSYLGCFPDVQVKRESLPLIIIVDFVDFKNDYNHVADMVAKVNKFEYDFIVFDLDKIILNHDEYYPDNTLNLTQFIEKVKPKSGVGFGLLVQHDVEKYRGKFDFKTSIGILDFCLLQSTDYKKCTHHRHQANMEILATKEDVEASIKCLSEMGVPFNKIIYTIDLIILSEISSEEEPMEYSYLCENKLSVHRKYCFNTIQLLFDKARLRTQYNTMGIYVYHTPYDDIRGSCGCTTANDPDPKFRGLKTIAGASQETVHSVGFYECNKGAFPVIL